MKIKNLHLILLFPFVFTLHHSSDFFKKLSYSPNSIEPEPADIQNNESQSIFNKNEMHYIDKLGYLYQLTIKIRDIQNSLEKKERDSFAEKLYKNKQYNVLSLIDNSNNFNIDLNELINEHNIDIDILIKQSEKDVIQAATISNDMLNFKKNN